MIIDPFRLTTAASAICAALIAVPAAAQEESTPMSPLVDQINDGNWLETSEAQELVDELYYQRAVHAYMTMLNDDGSIDIWFAPEQPEGVADTNFIQTIPGRNFMAILRLYGAEIEFYDQTWKPDDLVKSRDPRDPTTGAPQWRVPLGRWDGTACVPP